MPGITGWVGDTASAVREAADELVARGDMGMAVDGTLCGACGDITVVLWRMLGENEYSHIVSGQYNGGSSHTWLYIPTFDMVLDLTATQFGKRPKVFFVDVESPYRTDYISYGFVKKVNRNGNWGDPQWRRKLKRNAERKLK